MTEREALKLTLAALKQIDEAMPFPVAKLAIMEAEKALAQPEPVIDKSAAVRIATALGWEPKRTWQGLTMEERLDCTQSPFKWDNYRAIEAKLKQKNT